MQDQLHIYVEQRRASGNVLGILLHATVPHDDESARNFSMLRGFGREGGTPPAETDPEGNAVPVDVEAMDTSPASRDAPMDSTPMANTSLGQDSGQLQNPAPDAVDLSTAGQQTFSLSKTVSEQRVKSTREHASSMPSLAGRETSSDAVLSLPGEPPSSAGSKSDEECTEASEAMSDLLPDDGGTLDAGCAGVQHDA